MSRMQRTMTKMRSGKTAQIPMETKTDVKVSFLTLTCYPHSLLSYSKSTTNTSTKAKFESHIHSSTIISGYLRR